MYRELSAGPEEVLLAVMLASISLHVLWIVFVRQAGGELEDNLGVAKETG